MMPPLVAALMTSAMSVSGLRAQVSIRLLVAAVVCLKAADPCRAVSRGRFVMT